MKENKMNMPNSAQTGTAPDPSNVFNMETLTGLFNNGKLPEKLKEYSDMAVKKVNNLSTTQKVIGGAILLLGAGYLTRRSNINLGGLAGKFGGLAGRMKH